MNTNPKRLAPSLVLMAALSAGTPALAADNLKVSTGFDYSVGAYGETKDTTITSIPITLKYSSGAWSYKGSVSYITMKGPDTVVIADGSASSSGAGTGAIAEQSGIGDTTLSVTRALDLGADQGLFLDLTGKAKVPTGDSDKGLSTGETDYKLQLDLAMARDGWMPLATLGYKWPGSSATYTPDNAWYASVGSQFPLAKSNVGFIYDYRQATSSTSDDVQELMLYSSMKVAGYSLTLYGTTGFSDASVDYGVGGQISAKF